MAVCDELESKLTTARGASEMLMAAAAREVFVAWQPGMVRITNKLLLALT